MVFPLHCSLFKATQKSFCLFLVSLFFHFKHYHVPQMPFPQLLQKTFSFHLEEKWNKNPWTDNPPQHPVFPSYKFIVIWMHTSLSSCLRLTPLTKPKISCLLFQIYTLLFPFKLWVSSKQGISSLNT